MNFIVLLYFFLDVKMVDPDFIIPERFFVAVCCFLSFNYFAMVGNLLPGIFTWVSWINEKNNFQRCLIFANIVCF